MKGFILGVILTLVAIPIVGVFFVRSSSMPVAATDAPLPFETTLAKSALHARIQREAPKRDAATFSAADLAAGAEVYQQNCAFCHSLPGQAPSAASKGMFPHPPQLFTREETVTDDPVGVTYWKVKNGIRLSGMPSFKTSLSEDQMWDVSALMARADNLPAEALLNLKAPAAAPAQPPAPNAAAPAAPK